MTKSEMIASITEATIEAMDINDLIEYATEMMTRDLAKLSKAELADQYEYVTGSSL